MKKTILLLMSALVCQLSFAWDGIASGRISLIEVTHGENLGFRVRLEGEPALCPGQVFTYLNESDSNYKVYVAALLSAKMSGSTVQLYSTLNPNGYCKLGHLGLP